MGGGAPNGQAQVVVSGVYPPEIEAKAEEVFYRHGFDFKGSSHQEMVFERKANISDEILYGNWEGNSKTITRVTLYIIPKEPGTYALRTRSVIERRAFGGYDESENFDVQGSRYSAILNKIKRELREENPQAN